MVSMLTSSSSAVDRGFEPWSGQTKDYKIGICCFSANPASLRRKNKDWLAVNQDNVSELGNMSMCGLFQWASTIKIQLSLFRRPGSSTKWASWSFYWKLTCSSYLYRWKIAELALNNNHSLSQVQEILGSSPG